ncbi:MAG: acyltransferase [Planctomycetaceae bacterium]|nr:acyltransferase [Planctomycetaceae bacterium]
MRRSFYGFHAGPSTRVLENVIVYHPERLLIGTNVGITSGTQINAGGGVTIEDNVLIGPGCFLWSQNHTYRSSCKTIASQGYTYSPVIIEADSWIGAGAIILPGVSIRRGTVVAAGAVVTKDTEPFTVVAGIPARPIGRRESSAIESPPPTSLSSSGPIYSCFRNV